MSNRMRILLLIVSVICLSSLFFLQNSLAQEIPVLDNVWVKASVSFDESLYLYTYSYESSNAASNTGSIDEIQIDISRLPMTQELSASNLVIHQGLNWRGERLNVSFENKIASIDSLLRKPVIPIGLETPPGWLGDISVMGTAFWGSIDESAIILPDTSMEGFIITSPGIPAIRTFSARPEWVYSVDHYVTEEDIEESERIEEQITFRGKTVGPTAPPEELIPADFLKSIIDMKHEAAELGWITNKGIERSLDVKLEAALKKLEQGNKVAARDIIGAFINEVEAQGCESYDGFPEGRHLAPEAYALLKYNAQYLIDNLER